MNQKQKYDIKNPKNIFILKIKKCVMMLHFLDWKYRKKLGLVKKLLLFFHILKIGKIERILFELVEVFVSLRNSMIMMISNAKE